MSIIETEHEYNSPMVDVLSLYLDSEETRRKFSALGARNVAVSIDGSELEIHREVPNTPPAMLKKLIKAWTPVKQLESWAEKTEHHQICRLSIHIDKLPVKIESIHHLKQTANGCCSRITVEVKTKVPFLAKYVAAETVKAMADEFAYIEKRLLGES
jgi:hypothetical protein